MTGREKKIEIVKNTAIAALLVALVCLCTIYLFSYQGSATPAFTREAFEALDDESVRYRYQNYLSPAYTRPSFIGLSATALGEPVGFCRGGTDIEELYEEITSFFGKLFGTGSRSQILSAAEGESAFLAALAGDYIYLSFPCDLPKSVLLALTEPAAMAGGVSGEYLRELLIVPEEEAVSGVVMLKNGMLAHQTVFGFSALARNADGIWYRFTTSYVPDSLDAVGFHTNLYAAYNTIANAFPFQFACLIREDAFLTANGFSEKVTDTTVIPGSAIFQPSLVMTRKTRGEDELRALLETLYMKPQKVSVYTDEAGTRYYFDEGETLKISTDGVVEYVASEENGIPLSTILGYPGTGREYGVSDHLGAVLILLNSLDTVRAVRETAGMDVVLCGIVFDGETVTFRFGYTQDNLPVFVNGRTEHVRISVRDGKICEVVCDAAMFGEGENFKRIPDMMLTLRTYLLKDSGRCRALPAYAFESGVAESDVVIVKMP